MTPTPYSDRIQILADLWLNYRNDEEFVDFIEYNDIGLPLAYILANEIVKPSDMSERFINETFDLLLAGLEIEEDTGFESLDDILGVA
jgi:hypothetical protein